MTLKQITLFIFLPLITPYLPAQTINGIVVNEEKEPLPFTNVIWKNTKIGTTTNEKGKFKIIAPDNYPEYLIVSFVGYQTDTIKVWENMKTLQITLKSMINLKEFEVTKQQAGTNISLINPILVETLNQKELKKAACCSVSESFETNASVDVNITDAVSGTKKIQMLGLDGTYTQIQFENIPLVRGLSASSGLNFIPGTWVESIQIKKGAGSVVNGYESITGQINLELLKPDNTDKFYLNIYGNEMGRNEVNVHLSQKLNEKWSSLLFAHVSNQLVEIDRNKDQFLDTPLKKTYTVFNRWKYFGEKYMSQFGIRVLADDINAGQLTAIKNRYDVQINMKQIDGFFKNGFLFNSENSIGVIANVKYHSHQSNYGLTDYNAEQTNGYLNIVYSDEIINEATTIKSGLSVNYDNYEHHFNDSSSTNIEVVPGAFAEYTYNNQSIALVAGIRGDHHNQFGFFASPRLHFKYNFTELSAFRLSAGSGFRTANTLIENSSYLISSRRVLFLEDLKPEKAWNYGTSISHIFSIGKVELNSNIDYYYTNFQNQVIADVEHPSELSFYNLNGKSYSHALQAELSLQFKRFEMKTAYKWLNVKTQYNNLFLSKPYTPTHRALVNLGYSTPFEKWKFDITALWSGLSRIPSTSTNTSENRRPNLSKEYTVFNGQITRKWKHLDIYLGGENIFNYKQNNPIIDGQNPFGSNFDASMIWGPIGGRTLYAGLRYSIK
ncbi:MAG: TonB-dependent receptor [Vicingus serpentipes]|nr:TonB-dependent receptor [Vicingus serpentipes]